MKKKNISKNLSNVSVADLKDDELMTILDIRSKYIDEERDVLIKGLYYISLADGAYSELEKEVVENTAYTLGINSSRLEELTKDITITTKPSKILTESMRKKFKNELFSEMASLTYLKGFQTETEDECLMKVAYEFGIPKKNAEKTLEDIYFSAQGIKKSTTSALAKVGIGVGAVVASTALLAVTAGAAAPAIGAVLGNAAGFSGAAATAHGLALLGGGTIAAGGAGIAGGTAAIVTAGGIIGAGTGLLGVSVSGNISSAYDKKKLKAYVIQQMKEQKTLQEITDNMLQAIEIQKERISALEKANASSRDITFAKEAYENLTSQKEEIKDLYERENGKKK